MFQINDRKIGENYPPYIIAEMSNNHLKDLNRAYELVYAAKKSGVDALKIQTYTPDSLTIDCDSKDFVIEDALWKGKTYYELYNEIAMPLSWNKLLFEKAREVGITIFSSPFDEDSVDLLEDLNSPAYKIASFESKDPYFLKKVVSTHKPIILSTGVSSLNEIMETVTTAKDMGCKSLAVLHCISSYPAETKEMNLNVIKELKKMGVVVGLSDHSLSNLAAVLSVGLGASIIEKHYTISRSDGGPDAEFSLEPEELALLKSESYKAWEALGSGKILSETKRVGSRNSRSIYFVKDMKVGDTITTDCIRRIRPGYGLAPKYEGRLIGKKVSQDVKRGTATSWGLINE